MGSAFANKKRVKMQLAGMLGVSLLCVLALGSATFAWYQATASASVSSTTSTVNIVTSGPEDIDATFYYYKDNGTNGYTTTTPSSSFNSDFKEVTQASHSRTTDMWPGTRMTFALRFIPSKATKVTLDLAGFVSNPTSIVGEHRYLYDSGTTTTDIRAALAVNIYATIITEGTYASTTVTNLLSSDDKFPYSLDNPIKSSNLVSSSVGALYQQLIFTVEFSNVNTTYFQEVDSSGNDVYVSGTGTRYFRKTTDGNSSVYEGLGFQITTLILSE